MQRFGYFPLYLFKFGFCGVVLFFESERAMEEYLKGNNASFIDNSEGFENWKNRELLVESYKKLIEFIKTDNTLLEKLYSKDQYHFHFAEHLKGVES